MKGDYLWEEQLLWCVIVIKLFLCDVQCMFSHHPHEITDKSWDVSLILCGVDLYFRSVTKAESCSQLIQLMFGRTAMYLFILLVRFCSVSGFILYSYLLHFQKKIHLFLFLDCSCLTWSWILLCCFLPGTHIRSTSLISQKTSPLRKDLLFFTWINDLGLWHCGEWVGGQCTGGLASLQSSSNFAYLPLDSLSFWVASCGRQGTCPGVSLVTFGIHRILLCNSNSPIFLFWVVHVYACMCVCVCLCFLMLTLSYSNCQKFHKNFAHQSSFYCVLTHTY